MDSMHALPEPTGPEPTGDDRSLALPVHCTTTTAEDLRVRLVLSFDLDETTEVDASHVASIGQACLQVLIAANLEAGRAGQPFSVASPSAACLDRLNNCGLAHATGVMLGEGESL